MQYYSGMVLNLIPGREREKIISGGDALDTSAESLVQHWAWASKKGLMNSNTAAGLRGACTQVLSALGDDWKEQDISKIDADDILLRFTNLRKKDFKPAVLEAYRARFRKALSSYQEYLRDPGGWKPASSERAEPSERRTKKKESSAAPSAVTTELATGESVDYNFPLRSGVIARLVLPRDLTRAEVRRLSAFMSMLVIDESTNIETGEEKENAN